MRFAHSGVSSDGDAWCALWSAGSIGVDEALGSIIEPDIIEPDIIEPDIIEPDIIDAIEPMPLLPMWSSVATSRRTIVPADPASTPTMNAAAAMPPMSLLVMA
jgi:hypothetical protein